MMVRYGYRLTHPTMYKNLIDRSTEDQEAAKATKPGVLPEAAAPDFSYI